MPAHFRFPVTSVADVERARRDSRELLTGLGFSKEQIERVVLAVSELSTNLVRYSQGGEIAVTEIRNSDLSGVEIESRDQGPGILDITEAMRDGFSTGGGLGSGLPAVRRLMDEFEISSSTNGTTILARKWLSNA